MNWTLVPILTLRIRTSDDIFQEGILRRYETSSSSWHACRRSFISLFTRWLLTVAAAVAATATTASLFATFSGDNDDELEANDDDNVAVVHTA